MQRIAILFAACALVTLAGCGADTHDKVMTEQLNLITEMNNTLDTVKDKESAEAAKPKLESIGKEMEALKKRADALGDPPAEVEAELKTKHEAEMTAQAGRMMGNMFRIMANPEIAAILEPAMKNMEP